MKKVIVILTVCFLTISCGNNEVTISKEEYNELKGVSGTTYPKPFQLFDKGMGWDNNEGIVLGSDEHEYLITNWGNNGENVEHYIDCDFCKSREKDEKNNINK